MANNAWTTTMRKIEVGMGSRFLLTLKEKFKSSLIDLNIGTRDAPVWVKDTFVQYHDDNLLICFSASMFVDKTEKKSRKLLILCSFINYYSLGGHCSGWLPFLKAYRIRG